MYAAPQRDRERIDGLATFVAAAFLTRSAWWRRWRGSAPRTASSPRSGLWSPLLGLVTLGLVNRTARLGDFLGRASLRPAVLFRPSAGGDGGGPGARLRR